MTTPMKQLESALRELGARRARQAERIDDEPDREALFDRIVATPVAGDDDASEPSPRRRSWRRYWRPLAVGSAVAAIAAAAFMIRGTPVTELESSRAFGAVAVHEGEDFLTIQITERDPDPAQIRAAFEAYGFGIDIRHAAATPGQVGFFLVDASRNGNSIFGLQGVEPITASGERPEACTGLCRYVGVRIPRSLEERAANRNIVKPIFITIGREPTSPAEPLDDLGARTAFAPGEVLHCSGLLGMPVEQARPLLHALGFTKIVWNGFESRDFAVNVKDPDWSGPPPFRADEPEELPDWLLRSYVGNAGYVTQDVLHISTGRKPRREGHPFEEKVNRGC